MIKKDHRTITGRGSCLCGGVSYEVKGPLRPIIVCHCLQCRKTSGAFVMASACEDSDLVMIRQDSLLWYDSSPQARRGFCQRCGGNLFWKKTRSSTTSLMAGCLDNPTGLSVERHIFYQDRSDFVDRLNWNCD